MWEPVRELAHNAGFARTLAHGSEHLGDSGKYKNQLDMDPKQIQIRESHVADNSQKKGNPNQSDAHFVVCGGGGGSARRNAAETLVQQASWCNG